MIFAYPGETPADQRESIRLIMDICRRYPGAEFWTNIFSPYPGAPVMEHAFELGIHVPKTFEEWSDFFPRYQVLPWMSGKKHERLQIMREYLRMAFQRVPVSIHRKDRFTLLAHELLAIPSRWRLDHDVYGLPLEIWLNQAARRVFKPLKPKVDAQQLSSEPVTC